MPPADSPPIKLSDVVGLFFKQTGDLGLFDTITGGEAPSVATKLLDHNQHMTVTVEAHHGCPVNVHVLQEFDSGNHYCRKILLSRSSDDTVVQFGIVRLDMSVLSGEIQSQIREKKIPLGRILITHDVMRAVRRDCLYRITMGEELASHFASDPGEVCFGRTAWMFLGGKPAMELLEVVPG